MNDDLLMALLAQHRPRQKSGGVVEFICTVVVVALAVCGGYFLLEIWFDAPTTPPAVNSAPARAPTALPLPPPSRHDPAAPELSLPDCATVTDTTTACVRSVDLAPPTATAEPPAPAQAEQPAYVSACITPPGERPCWLPADQPWSPPAEVPATPLVFAQGVCAEWRPPQVLPEGCP